MSQLIGPPAIGKKMQKIAIFRKSQKIPKFRKNRPKIDPLIDPHRNWKICAFAEISSIQEVIFSKFTRAF